MHDKLNEIDFIGVLEVMVGMKGNANASIRNSSNFHRFIRSTEQHVDAILIETLLCEEMIGFGHYFNALIISISSTMETTEMYPHTIFPTFSSFTPNPIHHFTDNISFGQYDNIHLSQFSYICPTSYEL